jgi:two-component system sensor histidine kinase/response regulator
MKNGRMRTSGELSDLEIKELFRSIYLKADRLNERVLFLMFGFGIFIALFYNTWLIAFGVGGLCLLAYFITKKLLPESNLYQYVLSAISAILAAQYIYQMHGMAEMHFWVFINSTIFILYQNWRLQIPLIVLVIIHHGSFAYLQYIGYKEIYFTQLAYMDLTTFLFHGILASCVCFIAGVWSYNIRQRTVQDASNLKALSKLQQELQQSMDRANELNREMQTKNKDLKASEEMLLASSEELKQINENLNSLVENRTKVIIDQNKKLMHHAFVSAHKVRSPLARILGLVDLIKHEMELSTKGKELHQHLKLSAHELDDILREVRVNLNESEYLNVEPEKPQSTTPGDTGS